VKGSVTRFATVRQHLSRNTPIKILIVQIEVYINECTILQFKVSTIKTYNNMVHLFVHYWIFNNQCADMNATKFSLLVHPDCPCDVFKGSGTQRLLVGVEVNITWSSLCTRPKWYLRVSSGASLFYLIFIQLFVGADTARTNICFCCYTAQILLM